jgi:cytidine deaminase
MTKHQDMLQAAKLARSNAYAPYSRFAVGACILSSTGKFYSGCNVENASYGLSICAEVNAIGNMISNGDTKISEILILGPETETIVPCGRCRQMIHEFGGGAIPVHLCDKTGISKTLAIKELLPYAFDATILEKP